MANLTNTRARFEPGKYCRCPGGGDNRNYTLKVESGGAREEDLLKGFCSDARTGTTGICPQTPSLWPNDTGKIKAGNAPAVTILARDLSATACLTIFFDGLDSSISCRIACRSSVAETTGNSSIKTQPNRTNGRIRWKRGQSLAQTDWCRHIQMAGSASVSQRRLSNNSIARRNRLTEKEKSA